MMLHEVELFFLGAAAGLILAAFFDFFRALRKCVRHSAWAVSVEDGIFWLTVTGVLFCLFEVFNHGVLRFYVFLGCAVGCGTYLGVGSPILFPLFFHFFKIVKWFLRLGRDFFRKGKKIVKKILILPLKNILEKIKIIRNNI